jgi:hypothetical protein
MLNLNIPEINNKPKTTKDFVITILSKEWPLSLRNIFYKIKKGYGYSSTYQSVFKAVNELLEDKTLVKKENTYMINLEWVKDLQSFTDIVETNYYAKEKLDSLSVDGIKSSNKNANTTILEFESIFDTEKYLYYLTKLHLLKKEKQTVCWYNINEWRPIFYLRSEYNYYKRLIKRGHRCYILCSGKSEIEKENRDFYKNLGVSFKFTSDRMISNIIIFNDYVIQIFIPEQMLKQIETNLQERNTKELIKLLESKTSIKVIITKDKDLAKQMQDKIIAKF